MDMNDVLARMTPEQFIEWMESKPADVRYVLATVLRAMMDSGMDTREAALYVYQAQTMMEIEDEAAKN